MPVKVACQSRIVGRKNKLKKRGEEKRGLSKKKKKKTVGREGG